jgi:hypothetical protein
MKLKSKATLKIQMTEDCFEEIEFDDMLNNADFVYSDNDESSVISDVELEDQCSSYQPFSVLKCQRISSVQKWNGIKSRVILARQISNRLV